ncbi:LPXTG cell wall anchor domain-containing protein [Arthrobacter sulfonylureivorans]|uniref:LPXTG cell wall anchor domain-containing protein n=1 Tax=Arthrobacter sulfonylureivorans TaxID=2486855 RepID=UPI0039E6CF71
MYGAEGTSAAGAAGIAATGLSTGSLVLAGVGLALALIAVAALLRRRSKSRP